MLKDLRTKVKTGFIFPIHFNEVVHLVNDLGIKMIYTDERVRVRFRNLENDQKDELLLMRFYQGECLTIYSVPESIKYRIEKDIYLLGVKLFSEFKDKYERSPTKDYFYEIVLDTSEDEIVFKKETIHLKKKLEFTNKPTNRMTCKAIKSDTQILKKIKYRQIHS